jgi:two-component system, OmpR family, sensor histidine kinase QseC
MAITVSAVAFIVFVVLAVLVYSAVEQSSARQFDDTLSQQAYLIQRYADHEYREGEAVVPKSGAVVRAPSAFGLVYQIATRDNALIYQSAGAPATLLAHGTNSGFSTATLPGGDWRVYTTASSVTPLVVHVAEPLSYRAALMSHTLRALAFPLVFALLLLTVLIGFATQRAFRPVRRMASDLARRSPHEATPVNTREMPVETYALGVALNGLLGRQAEVLARERRFTADAAHELRTPLAALRAQAQLLGRAATPAEMRRSLAQLQTGIDRCTHLVGQLLALARVEPGGISAEDRLISVAAVIEMVVQDLEGAARERRVTVVVNDCEVGLLGSFESLYLLIRNVVENGILYSPDGGQVSIDASADDERVTLIIEDNGPGIPPAERERVFERFYRIPGGPASGSGLGLSIVKRVVEGLAGRIELGNRDTGTGLRVIVQLPVRAPGFATDTGASLADETVDDQSEGASVRIAQVG